MSNRILSGAIERDPRKGICDHPDCDEKLPSRRRSFCSDNCGDLFFTENNWAGIRFLVFIKNLGKCQKCNKNLVFNKDQQFISFEKINHFGLYNLPNKKLSEKYLKGEIFIHIQTNLTPPTKENRFGTWCSGNCIRNLGVEIDHIHAIYKGGDPLDIENMQTLCNECHKGKTRSDRKGFEISNLGDFF